jgi:serine/threonine-protein kinase
MIEFRTLGGTSLLDADGAEIQSVLAQPKRLALLAYLALAIPRGFHRRTTLLALFWPDQDEKHARWSLNQALRHLRRGVGKEVLVSRGTDEVGLDFESISLDAAAFEEACEESRLEAALELYRGHLLEGFYIPGCPDLERWLEGERARLRRLAVSVAWALTDRLQESGEIAAAATEARKALCLSDHDGAGIRRLIELLDRAGDRGGAVQAYEDYAARLLDTLEVEPAPETQALIEAIRSRQPTQDGSSTLVPAEDGASDSDFEQAEPPDSEQVPTRTHGPTRWPRNRTAFMVLAVAASVIVLFLAQRSLAPDAGENDPWSADAAPGVAVLPFHVQGTGEAYLSEGMVDLLFGSLDGLAGIRPINSFTVLARWNEQVEGDSWPDLASALAVAEAAGARYAILGNAVAIGTEVRFAASLYETSGPGTVLGQANETAPRDSIWGAVDRLSIRLLRTLSEISQGELARLDSREVTTGSPEALKAYLRAQASYRRAGFEAAATDYELAIEKDPTFALAHLGLGWSLAWEPLSRTERAVERPSHWQTALEHSLTERQRLIARASLTYDGEFMSPDMAGELRQAVDRYPDDAQLWYLLGEHYLHVGTATGAFDDHGRKAEVAFERAVELVPDFVPYWAHLLDLAFIHADREKAGKLVSRIERLVPPGSRVSAQCRAQYRIFFQVYPETVEFQASLDTLEMLEALPRVDLELLGLPSLWPTAKAVGVRIRRSAPDWRDCRTRQRSLAPGLLGVYLTEALTSPADSWCLYLAQMLGLPMPEEAVDSVMTARLESMLAGRESFPWDLGVPLHLADRGRWAEYDAILGLWRGRSAAAPDVERVARDRWAGHFVTAAEAYGAWRRGNPDRAIVLLEGLPPEARRWHAFRWWLGTLYLEMNRPGDAVGQFHTLLGVYNAPNWTPAYFHLGRAYEQLGEFERAREQYAYFVDAWKDADPELQPRVDEARARLRELADGRH